jgi:hypothetical protein
MLQARPRPCGNAHINARHPHSFSGCIGRCPTGRSAADRVTCRAALWSRQPDEWDQQWEQEEQTRRQQTQQVSDTETGYIMASCVDQAHHVVQTAVKQHCGCVLTDSNIAIRQH